MKLKNVLFSLIAIFVLLFADVVKAETTVPSSFTVNGSDQHRIDSSKYMPNNPWSFYYKQNSDGKIIYCVQSDHDAVTSGTQIYNLKGETDAKFAYVMANGYPNKNITGDKEKDYFITALAVFYLVNPKDQYFNHYDLEKGTYRGKVNDVVVEVAKLVNGAKDYSYTNPTIKITSNDTFTLSSDNKYYISSNLNVSASGNIVNYTVELDGAPNSTIITDVNGNKKKIFSVGESFIIKVPVSSVNKLSNEFKINVNAISSEYKAYLYTPVKSKFQNTTVLYPDNIKISDTTTIKLNLTNEIEISKIDVTTGTELPGATLVVKDSKGKVIDEWVSTNEVHVIKGLNPGKYTLTETIAPEGYVLSTETITFEVKADGSVTKVVMKNEMTTTEISKVDVTTKKELPGATLVVKDSKGKVIDEWVSTNEVHVIKGLKVGKYTLTEIIAPEGYVLSTETITFEVKNDGSVTKVVMENKPKDKTPIYISKQDLTTKEELPGAHLELKNEKGEIVEAWVSTDVPHMIEELEPGKYFLTEAIAPEGYELSTETVEFVVKEDGTVDGVVVMYNKVETIEVPPTASFKTITSSLIGIIVIGLGSMIIYKNYKKNEEY